MLNIRGLGIAACASLSLAACASYDQRHVEYGASQLYPSAVTENGITLAAEAYDSEAEVVEAFDENLLEKGYYPVKVLIENNSENRVLVYRESVELRDHNGYSYRPVTAAAMAEDFEDNKVAYALLGFGIFSYLSADEANKERTADYQAKDLGESEIVAAGRSRGSFIYFQLPQGSNLATSRLMMEVEDLRTNETTHLELPLSPTYAGGSGGASTAALQNGTTDAGAPRLPPFDGVWILEVGNGRAPDDRVRTVVTNGRFSASFHANGWRGTIEGEINEFGTLIASGTASKMAWGSSNVPLDFTTHYRSGGFAETVVAKGRVKAVFDVSLKRDQAGG